MWSNESRFQLHYADGRVRIWRKQHESMHPTCMSTTLQAGGGSFMVWGMFSWHDLGPLICVEQHLNSTIYLSIIADQVHPIMLMADPNGDGFFQQDNAHAMVLILCRSGFKNMREALPCLGGPHNHQISIQLSICGTKIKESSGSWFHDHQISQNWTVLFIRYGVRFLASPFNISWRQCQEESPQY
uniref:Uncharacterized protein n=1 Tax=Myotis myotis TaxID=51298 RepID=A0A7J7TJM8_MYOMY|nr:hypothetical protein mMyoMyo1_009100 [Myotis myotis]